MNAPADLAQRFILENLDIRGSVIRLGPLWRTILSRREYPGSIHSLLGEFSALAVLIAAGLKHPGRAVLQVMGHGPISMAVADCTHELALRAMVKAEPGWLEDPGARHDLPALFADGRLALTIENHASARHFQSIVPLEGVTLAECFERYFDRSEQVPTHLWALTTFHFVGALILQKLPEADRKDASGWARIQQLAAQRAPQFLTQEFSAGALPEREASPGSTPQFQDLGGLIADIFPDDDVRLFAPHRVMDGCSRSEERVVAMLRGLGRTEVEATLAERGVVAVHDEICNQEYRFTAVDVERIFRDWM
jgi:molecular chaperone Hsp33